MQNATKSDYMRYLRNRATAGKPAWVDPLLTFIGKE
jgi:hypothetical protein